MNEFKRAEKAAFAVGLAIALSVDVIMNVLHFVGLVWLWEAFQVLEPTELIV